MSNTLLLSHAENTFGLSYSVQCDLPNGEPAAFCVPRSRMKIYLNLVVNGAVIPRESEYAESFRHDLVASLIWKSLMFEVSSEDPQISEPDDMINATVILIMKCQLFNKISGDLKHLPVSYLSRLHLTFECWTPNLRIYLETLKEYLQYALTSLMINLEYKYPFVFSFYGKRFVEVNYQSLVRSTTDLMTPLHGDETPDKNVVLRHCLEKLQSFILYEYNTLNIMMECDTNSYRLKMCRESLATGNYEYYRKSLKNSVFCLLVPACAHLDCGMCGD